jgi:hypothetical protein
LQPIKGDSPVRELLQQSDEDHLLHPTVQYRSASSVAAIAAASSASNRSYKNNNSKIENKNFIPEECGRWNCSVCFSLMKFDTPIKYGAFLGG